MKVCVVGAGAVGGFLGFKMAQRGDDVVLVTLGDHLDAIKKNGLKLISQDGSVDRLQFIKVDDNLRRIGPQDLIILAVKSHDITSVAIELEGLYAPHTTVLTTQNGIPWWYFQNHGGRFDGLWFKTLDPSGLIAKCIPADRIIGCIAYIATEIVEPGVIRHIEGIRFPMGELDGRKTKRITRITDAFVKAGLKSVVLSDVRSEIWLKALGAVSFNPISALTHSSLVEICEYLPTRKLVESIMLEAQSIAIKLGVTLRLPIERRIAGAEKVGNHKTSMLQDVELGRTLELSSTVEAIIELADLTDTPVPHIRMIYSCIQLISNKIDKEQVLIKARKGAFLKERRC